MINLLPSDEQRQLRAARSNVLLLRYNIFLLGAVAFLALAVSVTYLYLSNTKTVAQQTVSENNSQVSDFTDVEQQAQQFRSNLAIAKQILNREVIYTTFILEIARLLPNGVVLEGLNLDAETFGTETTLSARAKDYPSALALKDSFQKSDLFTDVHFQSISTGEGTDTYPVTISMNVTIKKDIAQ